MGVLGLLVCPVIQVGEPVSLRPGRAVEHELSSDHPVVHSAFLDLFHSELPVVGRSYRIDVEASGAYHVGLTSDDFDAYLVLRDAGGRVLIEDDDSLRGGPHAGIAAWLEASATYTVDACALHGGRGAFRLTLAGADSDQHDREQRAALTRARRADLEQRRAALRDSRVAWLDGHALDTYGVRMSPDGERAATLGTDGTGWLWNAWTGEPVGFLGVHDRIKAELEFSADGERILVFDRPAGLADLRDGRSAEPIATLEVGEQVLSAAAFSPDGTRVATGDVAGVVRLFDAASGRPLGSPIDSGDVDELWFSPDGSRLLTFAAPRPPSLWDVDSGVRIAELEAPPPGVSWVRFGADGERVLGLGAAHTALVWNLETPGPPSVLHEADWVAADWGVGLPSYLSKAWGRGDYPTEAMVAGRDPSAGRALFVLHAAGGASLRDGSTGRHLAPLQGIAEPPGWILFGPHGDRLVTRDGVGPGPMRLWDTTGRQLARPSGKAWIARFSPSGERLVTGTPLLQERASLNLFDGRNGEHLAELPRVLAGGFDFGDRDRLGVATYNSMGLVWDGVGAPVELVSRLAIPINEAMFRRLLSADGSLAAPISRYRGHAEVSVWDRVTGLPSWTLPLSPLVAQFLPDDRLVVVGPDPARPSTRTLDAALLLRDGSVQRRVRLEGSNLEDVSNQALADPGGRRLAARGFKGGARLWDLESGALLVDIPDVAELEWVNYVGQLIELGAGGALMAAATERGIDVVESERGSTLASLPGRAVGLAMGPDGYFLAVSRRGTGGAEIEIWELAAEELVRTLEGHTDDVYHMDFDAQGTRLVTAGRDGTARIWDVESGAALHVLTGHTGPLNYAFFSPDSARVLTASLDGTARLWSAESGASLALLAGHTGEVRWVEFSADGRRILTASTDATERVWDGASGRLLATRVEYEDGWLVFEPTGHYAAAGGAVDRARIQVQGRTYPLSSYASVYESPDAVAASLAGETVRPPTFVPRAPDLRIAAPLDTAVQERAFRLEALVDDTYGIEGMVVEQDGVALDAEWLAEHLELAAGGRSGRLSCELAVPEGSTATTVRVRASNVRGILSVVDTVHVRYEPPQRELFLLAMGVADYEDDSLDLAYPTKDADDLIARFQAEEGGFYSRVNVHRLADDEVTPGRLRKMREEFLLRAEPEDTILVFAAGHGVRSASGEYYFLTPGTTPDEPYDGIERQVLESLVTWDRLHASRRILLLDTCHSGEAFGEGKRGVALDSFDQAEVDEAAGTGLYIIAASSEAGFAQEMEGNGLFTKALLEGLDGAADENGDGVVGIDELKTYATTAVHERSAGRQRPTAPRIEGGEDFPLARKP